MNLDPRKILRTKKRSQGKGAAAVPASPGELTEIPDPERVANAIKGPDYGLMEYYTTHNEHYPKYPNTLRAFASASDPDLVIIRIGYDLGEESHGRVVSYAALLKGRLVATKLQGSDASDSSSITIINPDTRRLTSYSGIENRVLTVRVWDGFDSEGKHISDKHNVASEMSDPFFDVLLGGGDLSQYNTPHGSVTLRYGSIYGLADVRSPGVTLSSIVFGKDYADGCEMHSDTQRPELQLTIDGEMRWVKLPFENNGKKYSLDKGEAVTTAAIDYESFVAKVKAPSFVTLTDLLKWQGLASSETDWAYGRFLPASHNPEGR